MTIQAPSVKMKTKKIFRFFSITILSLFLALLMGALIPSRWGAKTPKSCDYKVCVFNGVIHSDIVVPVKNKIFDWQKYLSLKDIGKQEREDYNYLSFGWGDRDFYMNTPTRIDLKIYKAFIALFLPTSSVMQVQGYKTLPKNVEVKCVGVSKSGYLKLTEFINDTFKVDNQGKKIRLSYGNPVNASFYDAKGIYSILRTCNSWTAEGLRSADVNTPLWAGLPSAIMFHLHNSCGTGKG